MKFVDDDDDDLLSSVFQSRAGHRPNQWQ